MKKILYLHGLESNQGGPKVDALTQNYLVCAPSLDYKNPNTFTKIYLLISSGDFDLIIGSSMGGYLAFTMGNVFDIPTLLFNPALHSRSFEPENHYHPPFSSLHNVIVGGEDEIINPHKTQEYLEENSVKYAIKFYPNMGHKTPLGIFINEVNNVINNQ